MGLAVHDCFLFHMLGKTKDLHFPPDGDVVSFILPKMNGCGNHKVH